MDAAMSTQSRFTTRFTVDAQRYHPVTDADRQEVKASIGRLKDLLPADIDPEDDPTIVYMVGNLAVGGVLNLNDDALSMEDALRVYPRFEKQQCNIEHNRGTIVGFIIKAGLSEFSTDKLITEDEARAANKPFNIVTVAAIWKVADKDLADFIMGMGAPNSPDKNKLSLSFEVGFDDYDVVVLPKGESNLAKASITVPSDSREFDRFDRMLRAHGGTGRFGKDARVGRVLAGNIIPLGQGIVTIPAAAVKGILPIITSPHTGNETDASGSSHQFSSTQVTLSDEEAVPYIEYAMSIPDDHIYTKEGDDGYGRELEPHVTACYGVKGCDSAPVHMVVSDYGSIVACMGEVSAFENADKPYDVLKVSVDSPDLHTIHHLIKGATDVESTNPDYHPHLTIAYLKKGMAKHYIGDKRFAGKKHIFHSISFRPHDKSGPVDILTRSTPQAAADSVYSDNTDDLMASPTRFLKLSEGWQERLAALQGGKDPLVNGVSVTLSDGRTLSNVKVFDGKTLELDKELSMEGIIITTMTMTPGMEPQVDDSPTIHPHIDEVAPTIIPEKSVENDADQARQDALRNMPYTDATKQPYGDVPYADPGYQADKQKRYPVDTEEHIRAAWSYINHPKNAAKYSHEQVAHIKAKIVSAWKSKIDKAGPEGAKAALDDATLNAHIEAIIAAFTRVIPPFTSVSSSSVTPITTSAMPTIKIEDLKQLEATVKSAEKIEDVREAFANVAILADAIAKESEKQVKARQDAEAAKLTAETNASEIRAQLEQIQKSFNELKAAQQATAAEQKFNERMSVIAEVFDLEDDVRAELVDEVKACVDDASFDKWLSKAKKMMKEKTKEFKKKQADDSKKKTTKKDGKPDTTDDDEDGEDDDAKAAKAAATALASAAATIVDPAHDNSLDAGEGSLKDRYMKAFAAGISIGGTNVTELIKGKK